MTKSYPFSYLFMCVAASSLWLVACGDDAVDGPGDTPGTVEGRITNNEGYSSPTGSSSSSLRLAGSGTTAAAVTVKAHSVADNGSLTVLAEAEVQSDNTYVLEVDDASEQKFIVRAYDESDAVVGSVIVEANGTLEAPVKAMPISSETSLESEIFLSMVANSVTVEEANTIDMRVRINDAVAASLRVEEDGGANIDEDINALAEAVVVAQATEIKAYDAAGVQTSQSALFDVELASMQAFSAEVHANTSNSTTTNETAYAEFLVALESAAGGKGADEEARARAESSASVGFRAHVNTQVSADVANAAILQAAYVEARANALAVQAVLSGTAAATLTQATDAGVALQTSVLGATTVDAAVDAYVSYSGTLISDDTIVEEASVLGNYLDPDDANTAVLQTSLDVAITSMITATVALDTALDTAVNASAGVSLNVDALAAAIVEAHGVFFTSVESTSSTLTSAVASANTNAEATATILIAAEGTFRVGGSE